MLRPGVGLGGLGSKLHFRFINHHIIVLTGDKQCRRAGNSASTQTLTKGQQSQLKNKTLFSLQI